MSIHSQPHPRGSLSRQADYPVDPLFIDRWSPRAFSAEPIARDDLFTAFEAARWAPSSLNYQPWRFVFALRETARFDDFLGLLAERNRQWAHKASAVVFFLSDTRIAYGEKVLPSPSHAFDTGAAWANFAHQIHLLGYAARAVGGFDREAAPGILGVPERFNIHAAAVVGRPDHPGSLPESFREKEGPSSRRPLSDIVFENRFPA